VHILNKTIAYPEPRTSQLVTLVMAEKNRCHQNCIRISKLIWQREVTDDNKLILWSFNRCQSWSSLSIQSWFTLWAATQQLYSNTCSSHSLSLCVCVWSSYTTNSIV